MNNNCGNSGASQDQSMKRTVIEDRAFQLLCRPTPPTPSEEKKERSAAVSNSLRQQILQRMNGGMAVEINGGVQTPERQPPTAATGRPRKSPTMEEREAAYELARLKIFGEDHKPEELTDDKEEEEEEGGEEQTQAGERQPDCEEHDCDGDASSYESVSTTSGGEGEEGADGDDASAGG